MAMITKPVTKNSKPKTGIMKGNFNIMKSKTHNTNFDLRCGRDKCISNLPEG